MARLTISEIFKEIASTVNQEATSPTSGGDEFNLWLQYTNRSIFEWSQATDWEPLRKTFFPSITGVSQATVSMPLDFRKIAAEPRLYVDGLTEGEGFPAVLPEQSGLYGSNDKYITTTGDISSGFSLIFHPATIASGASLAIQYFSTPTSLATTTDIPVVPDSQFVIDRVIAYIFAARSDARFQLQENTARERLLNMVENNTAGHYNSYAGQNPVLNSLQKQGFRVGRD